MAIVSQRRMNSPLAIIFYALVERRRDACILDPITIWTAIPVVSPSGVPMMPADVLVVFEQLGEVP